MKNNHSITKNVVHFVFVTKYRHSLAITEHMHEILEGLVESLNCNCLGINSSGNHFHLLVDVHPSVSLAEFACKVKSLSSGAFSKQYFNWESWQRGYYAESVGKGGLKHVKDYIENQN